MDVGDAYRTLSQITRRESEEEASESHEVEAMALVVAFRNRVGGDEEYEFKDQEPAAVFSMLAHLRQLADVIECDLIRELKWGGEGMTWEQVADAVDGQLGGRQAMQKRWSRLTSETRRTRTGDMRRGAAARRRTVSDVDTTTQEVTR